MYQTIRSLMQSPLHKKHGYVRAIDNHSIYFYYL